MIDKYRTRIQKLKSITVPEVEKITKQSDAKINNKTIIIGCGTGRCGTTSLSKLLNNCINSQITHEERPILPWIIDKNKCIEKINHILKRPYDLIGDVCLSYLEYIPLITKNIMFT